MMLKYVLAALVSVGVLGGGLPTQQAVAAPKKSVWSGVYTEQQAQRGKRVHAALCSQCHGVRLDGASQSDMLQAPAIAGQALWQKWQGQSIGSLFAVTKATMPPMSAESLTDQEYIDSIAYMLKISNVPPGDRELRPTPAELADILMLPAAKP